jgi:hypothetical protein
VFIGNQGCGAGTFSCVDDAFLPRDRSHYVAASLLYRDREGKPQTARYDLKNRC